MSVYINDRYRIKRNAFHESSMKMLIESHIFSSYAHILCLASVFGYRNKAYSKIESQASDGVLMQFFSEDEKDLIDMIAYAHSKNQNILKTDQKYEIFESYANGGYPILIEKLGINFDQIDITTLMSKQNEYLTQLYVILKTDDVDLDLDTTIID